MPAISRRTFLQTTSVALAAGAIGKARPAFANPLDLPLGLQLYSVRDLIAKDYDGTLKQLGALGFREVESAGYFEHTADQVKKSMTMASLRCVSAHYPLAQLQPNLDEALRFSKALGVKFIVCSSPMLSPSRAKGVDFKEVSETINMDDWKWNFEQFNRIAKRVKQEGMQFAYHNHTPEFRAENGVMPFDELFRNTDPDNMTVEMDCGWVAVAGQDPVEYLKKYPTRISMLHIKDFKLNGSTSVVNPPPSTELGRGSVDYRPIFAAAKQAKIAHYFIEQEEFDLPPWEALKIDADYIRNLKV